MSVYSAISGTALNMMHLLMAIMVTGLSVDYGIFTTCFFRADSLRGKHSLLPVTLCALSTLSGFGVLALAAHPALSSLGITVLTGIGAAWPAAIVVTPAILDTKKGAE
jgi:predicted exporter